MVTEKTAREREAAAVKATKPYFEKIGKGLEYLEQLNKSHAEYTEKELKAINERIELESEISIAEQCNQEVRLADLKKRYLQIEKQLQNDARINSERLFDMPIRCEKCGAFISQVQIVCHNCGAISTSFPYDIEESEAIEKKCYPRLSQLSERIKTPKSSSVPYPEIEKQVAAMSKIKRIADAYIELDNSSVQKDRFRRISEEAESFLRKSQNKRIEIAVAGMVKSGKSTLINALLNTRISSVNCTPETAVLVKYRTTKDRNYIKVSFYTSEQWTEIWDSVKDNSAFTDRYCELKADIVKNNYIGKTLLTKEFSDIEDLKNETIKWTSSNYPEYYFVNEVEVGICGDYFPNDVVLVDTPGLSDIVKYRSDITKHYLKNANWVLACVRYETMNSKDEAKFLEEVISNLQHNAKRMIIVGTQADKENSYSDAQRKQELFFKDTAPVFDKNEGILRDHFVSTQAEMHLLLHEYLAGKELSNEQKARLHYILFILGFSLADISNSMDDIENKFGITVLNKKLENKVYRKTRKQIIEMIHEDYEKANQNIRSLASDDFATTRDDLLMLDKKSDDYYETKEKIDSQLKDLSEKQDKISELISKLSDYTDTRRLMK